MSATNYIWDYRHDCVLAEKDDNGVTTAVYTHKPQLFGGLISQRRGSTSNYYHYDAIGSTERLTDASQATTDTYVYSAFGEERGTTGTTVNPFRYVGKVGYYYDGAALSYWVRERRYEPPIVRWLSIDPIRADFALYRYVANNPSILVDPTGFKAKYPPSPFAEWTQEMMPTCFVGCLVLNAVVLDCQDCVDYCVTEFYKACNPKKGFIRWLVCVSLVGEWRKPAYAACCAKPSSV